MKAARYPDFGLELLVPKQMWIAEKFYIERYDSPSRQREVRNHMRILSVVSIKAYLRYGYDYLSEIVLCRADFQEYKITEKDFKNLYPSDFEDQNLLLLQGHLDHLSDSDKRMLSTAVKLWTQNLVIRQRVKDFQLGIESYQKQLNLTKPGWDTKGYDFKHDYTIIESPRAAIEDEKDLPELGMLYWWTLGFNSLVHSLRALSTLRRSGLRTASAAAKPCQGDSSDIYLITGKKCEHAGPMVTTLHGGNITTRMIKRFTVADDLKESSKITQVKGTKFKDHYIMYKEINA
ncbi:hypothetical protein Tco_0026062 [Tanacetum coccineum]